MLRSRRHQVRINGSLGAADSVERLSGVGPKVRADLARHGIATVADLLWLLPTGYDDLRDPWSVGRAVSEAPSRPRAAVRGRVRSAGLVFGRGRRATRVVLEDREATTERLTCFWFFAAKGIVDVAKVGSDVTVVGRLSVPARGKGAFMAHPDLLPSDAEPSELLRPRYPYAGIPAGRLRSLIASVLEVTAVADPVPADIATREAFGGSFELARLHRPTILPTEAALRAAHERLAWAEAFSRAWIQSDRETRAGRWSARRIPRAPVALAKVEARLGFSLTDGQRAAVEDIAADLSRDEPMRRLLLGDVGSGKTAVIALAIAQTVAAGAQALVLAPTTILAEQYRAALGPVAEAIGARVVTVTGAASTAHRRAIEDGARRGEIDVMVGTHLLESERFVIPQLGLVVVDEQQRLGVLQRLALSDKGGEHRPHLLTVSATPIPRTLALAVRGELATSEITDLPAGRRPVVSELVPRDSYDETVLPKIRAAIDRSEAVLCVCPRIDPDEDEGVTASALGTFDKLRAAFGERVVLGHGRMAAKDLARSIERLRDGSADVLVGTTIVEVGLDIPRATLMVVDGAEQFGLSQLHQLRGRVGRSNVASCCLLVYDTPLAGPAEARLSALVRLGSGSDVARADLELRGAGDLGGIRQSGDSGLLYLSRFFDSPWLSRIPEDVSKLRADDPDLELPEHAMLRLFIERLPARISVREEAG